MDHKPAALNDLKMGREARVRPKAVDSHDLCHWRTDLQLGSKCFERLDVPDHVNFHRAVCAVPDGTP